MTTNRNISLIEGNGNNPYWEEVQTGLSEGDGFALHAGLVLKSVLAERGITASALSRHLGVGRAGFTDMLNGKRALTAPMASKVEDAIGYPAELLMTVMVRHEIAKAKLDEENHVQPLVLA